MKIKRNYQVDGEKRKIFLWLPVWNDHEILWLETVKHYRSKSSLTGEVLEYYERILGRKDCVECDGRGVYDKYPNSPMLYRCEVCNSTGFADNQHDKEEYIEKRINEV